jgi:hypothetical protein
VESAWFADGEMVGWLGLVLATLWFLWPFVLIFHSGRSILRVVLPLLIAYPFYFTWSHVYSRMVNHEKYGLPAGMELSPHGILGYAFWYGVGWVDAQKDARAGRLILEAYGFGTITPGAPNFLRSDTGEI